MAGKGNQSIDGYFKIQYEPEGIKLTVFAPLSGGNRVDLDDILQYVSNQGIMDANRAAVAMAVLKSSGDPVVIAPPQVTSNADSKFKVEISDDFMECRIMFLSPPGKPKLPSYSEVVDSLKLRGITYGIITDAIKEKLEKGLINEQFVAARGRPPVNGTDAGLEFKVAIKKDYQLKEKDDGSVDYHEVLGLIENVVEGQVLAVKIPPTPGLPGKNLKGEEIAAKIGRDINMPAGKNVEVSPDGTEAISAINGHVVWTGTKLNVEAVFEVRGDVGYETGNIVFVGSVVIHGQVQDGFSIKATGNIEVKGSVGKSFLEAEGDIMVRNGIMGKDEGSVVAEGDIFVKFAENANIEARRNVVVTEVILHSNIDAGEKIICLGKRGTVFGGRIRAGQEVNVKVLGSPVSTPTDVEVGVNPKTRQKFEELENEISKDKVNFEKIKVGIKTLQKLREKMGGLPPDKEQIFVQLNNAQNTLMEKLIETEERLSSIKAQLEVQRGGQVSVMNMTYAGVKITIQNSSLTVKEPYKFATFYNEGHEIKFKTYEELKLKDEKLLKKLSR